jgi:hypothetical protein
LSWGCVADFISCFIQHNLQSRPAVRFRTPWRRPSRTGIDNLFVQASLRTLGSRGLQCARLFGLVPRNRRTPRHESKERLGHTLSMPRRWYSTKCAHVTRSKRQESVSESLNSEAVMRHGVRTALCPSIVGAASLRPIRDVYPNRVRQHVVLVVR